MVKKRLKSDIAFLRYGNFIEDHNGLVEFVNFGNSPLPFYTKTFFFASNTSSNLKIKHWRFQNMWNVKIYFGTIFWLWIQYSKSSLPTTGTFRDVESHLRKLDVCYHGYIESAWKWIVIRFLIIFKTSQRDPIPLHSTLRVLGTYPQTFTLFFKVSYNYLIFIVFWMI